MPSPQALTPVRNSSGGHAATPGSGHPGNKIDALHPRTKDAGLSRATNFRVKADPAWTAALAMPKKEPEQRKARNKALNTVLNTHEFAAFAANTYASSLRKTWVREHLPAQEAQNVGKRAFSAVDDWLWGRKGQPRYKSVKRGLHSLSCNDGNGALRPHTDASGRLTGLQWGRGFVVAAAAAADSGRRGKEEQAELAAIEDLITAGKVLHTRIVRTIIAGRDTYRMQIVCDGPPPQRHPVGDGRVSFDLGPSQIAVAVEHEDGTWDGWIQPLADEIRLNSKALRRVQRHLDRQHRAGSPDCFNPDGTHIKKRCHWRSRTNNATRTEHRVAEQHRCLAQHRHTLHGRLANVLFGHGTSVACEDINYVSWQKAFPRSVRDRAPGLLVQMVGRKAGSAGGPLLYEYATKTTALSQTCLCGNRKKKPLSQRVHDCGCGITEDRDVFSAFLGLHVGKIEDGSDRLDLEAARQGWLHRHDVVRSPKSSQETCKRRGRRHPPSRRSVARIKARRKAKAAKRQSCSAGKSPPGKPTALTAPQAA